ncbi:MAG: VWA domain-containing protein [SAR202 cluster bacterium]|nr:VWA domain-containing protein [SAR202 cluster bacterium]
MINRGYRYCRWDGTQNVFDIDADELMERMSDELMQHGDVMKALREMFRRGMQNPQGQRMKGLQEMMEQLKNQRQQQLQRFNMDSVVEDLKKRLEDVVNTERQGIEKRVEEGQKQVEDAEGTDRAQKEALNKMLQQRAQRNKEKLDGLPESMGGAIKELMEYDFMDPEAQRKFQELLDMLKERMANNMMQDIKERLQGMTPEQNEALKEFFQDLNRMMREKMMGLKPDFQGFMDKWGQMFGDNPPKSFEELMERMAQQMAQMQSLMNSLSPEARQEMEEAINSALDPGLQRQIAELGALMSQLMPMDPKEYPFMGDDSLTMDQAMDLMGQMQQMDQLEGNLKDVMRTGKLDDIDPEKLSEILGEEARRAWEQLKELQRMLEEAGYVTGGDEPALTPRGIRKIGQRALQELFAQLKKDRVGNHEMFLRGATGEIQEDTKPFEFGDPFQVHLKRSISNAVLRQGPKVPVKLEPQDFEIYRNEHTTRAATAVLLDQSRSMGMYGAFRSAKKVAMALFSLIHSQYPRDSLYIIGFSDYAYEIKEEDIPKLVWNTWSPGTNLQHALMLSRKLLSKEKGGTRQIILITDGEPTAHLAGEQAYFSYPPSYQCIMETLKEVRRCTQSGIVINTFMLENSYQLVNFVDQLTRINKGRAFYSTPDRLGEYVMVDYLNNRRKKVV